jgi:hypothetical protein
MPAKDLFHPTVKTALQQAGWEITHDPYQLTYEDVKVAIDLGAEAMLGAEREGQKIAVEIKGFLSGSFIYDFHAALGQYINYRRIIQRIEPDRSLYLAVPLDAYKEYFVQPFYQETIREERLNLIVFDPVQNHISAWIP